MTIQMPKIIGHRGAAGCAPENTLAAIQYAIDSGVKAIEIDVTISHDNIAMIMHDFDVERTTNGQGPLILKTAEDLQKLDAGSKFNTKFKGEKIPLFKEALNLISDHDMYLNIEIKPTLGWEEPTARSTAETLQAEGTERAKILVSSMSTRALDVFHNLMPDIDLGLIVYAVPENWQTRMKQHACHSLHCYYDFATVELADQVHALGYRLNVYTVNEIDKAKTLFDMGVDAVFTDYPDKLQADL